MYGKLILEKQRARLFNNESIRGEIRDKSEREKTPKRHRLFNQTRISSRQWAAQVIQELVNEKDEKSENNKKQMGPNVRDMTALCIQNRRRKCRRQIKRYPFVESSSKLLSSVYALHCHLFRQMVGTKRPLKVFLTSPHFRQTI